MSLLTDGQTAATREFARPRRANSSFLRRHRRGHQRPITIGENGKGKQRVSRKGEFVVGAAWSPKGGTLGYVAGTMADRYGGRPSNLRVETASADGKRVHVLMREAAASLIWGRPLWTRDGKQKLLAVEPH